MKIDIFDTYVKVTDGLQMHFDVRLPHGEKIDNAKAYAIAWLRHKGILAQEIILRSCEFCHSDEATPELRLQISTNGYAILELDGCSSPI